MARFVPDVNTKRWLIIAPKRAGRPFEVKEKTAPSLLTKKNGYQISQSCPFCLGNEHLTPPEIYRWSNHNTVDWLVRVVPNKYPITDIHEVIIHSPDHFKDIVDFDLLQVEILLKIYRQRYQILTNKGSVIIFNNKGKAAGESLTHPHSQIVVIPKQIMLDLLVLEPVRNVVDENEFFISFCPDFSQWPYEVWLAKKTCAFEKHANHCFFGDITDLEIKALAKMLKLTLQKLNVKFANLSYNFYISPFSCWYLRIIPRLTERGGFELGTGLSVNIVDPAIVASELRKIKLPVLF